MSPNYYLLLIAGAMALGLSMSAATSVLRGRRIHEKATKLGLLYSHPDRFLLARRVARQLPIPGTSEVTVRDVAYRKVPEGLLCIMTARFTIGTTGRRRNLRRIVAALDPGGEELVQFEMLDGEPEAELYVEAHKRLVGRVPSAST